MVYVDYDMPGPIARPGPPHPDKTARSGFRNTALPIALPHSNPQTGEMKEFRVPNLSPALIHSLACGGRLYLVAQAGSQEARALRSKTET